MVVGILPVATGIDANDSLFPVAWAVVDIENNDNWLWFLRNLHIVIEINCPTMLHPSNLTFISDCQKGILEAVNDLFPDSPHAYCLKHLEECLQKAMKNKEVCAQLWKATRATTQEDFDKDMRYELHQPTSICMVGNSRQFQALGQIAFLWTSLWPFDL